jgi:hypothetical protein
VPCHCHRHQPEDEDGYDLPPAEPVPWMLNSGQIKGYWCPECSEYFALSLYPDARERAAEHCYRNGGEAERTVV